jgi:hypothetical protein
MTGVRVVRPFWIAGALVLGACGKSANPTASSPSSPPSVPEEEEGDEEGSGGILAAAVPGRTRTRPPCKPDLAACAADGCESPGSPHALFNNIKRRTTAGDGAAITFDTASPMTLQTMRLLQGKADSLVGQGRLLPADDRKKLVSFDVEGQRLGEGSAVRVAGFLAPHGRAPFSGAHLGGIESVNCRLTKEEERDIHIPLTPGANGDTECDGVVVEMIPQGRSAHAQWTTPHLHLLAKEKRLVLFVGPLFYDGEHKVRADCTVIGDQPKRMSLWEVHPVIEFYVCDDGDACRATSRNGWRKVD